MQEMTPTNNTGQIAMKFTLCTHDNSHGTHGSSSCSNWLDCHGEYSLYPEGGLFFCDFSNAIHLLQTHSHVLIKKIKLVFVEFILFFFGIYNVLSSLSIT